MENNRLKVRTKKGEYLWVRKEELELFEQIWIHRTMQAKSIHAFYQDTLSTLRNPNAISNRLTKLVEHELLIRLTKDVSVTRARVPRYYYRLGKKGLRLLAEQKKIRLNERTRKDYRSFKNSPVPSNHTDAMSILANQIYLCTRNRIPEMTHSRGVTGKILLKNGREQLIREIGIEPDWIFQVAHRLLCIEMDTGSQEHAIITRKFNRYEVLQEILKEEGYQVAVLFAVLDESIDIVQKNKRKERSGRVSRLNQLFQAHVTTPITSVSWLTDFPALKWVYAVAAQEASVFSHKLFQLSEWKDHLLMDEIKATDINEKEGRKQ